MNRHKSRGALGLVCAAAAVACGGSAASVPLPGDAVWCDVHAFGCGDFDFFTGPRASVGAGCGEPTSIPILVSPPIVGGRVCVGHNSTTAAAACASVCTALTADKPHVKFAYPKGAEGCVATINSDPSHAYDSGQFVRS